MFDLLFGHILEVLKKSHILLSNLAKERSEKQFVVFTSLPPHPRGPVYSWVALHSFYLQPCWNSFSFELAPQLCGNVV